MRGELNMKFTLLVTALALLAFGAAGSASARASCEEVKAKIEAALEAKGVKKYSLEVVPKAQATDLRVVGTCDGDTKKIIYKRE